MAEPNESQGQGQAPPETDSTANQPPTTTTAEDLKKIIQSETDKIRTHYSQEFKKQQEIIEGLKKSQMTEAELRKYKESQLSEREAMLQKRELELLSVDLLKDLKVSPELRGLIIGKDADDTKLRATTLQTEFQKALDAAVQERFKQAGRDPQKAADTPAGSKRTYTRAEIEELGKKAMDRGTPPADRAKLNEEIRLAALEGRIKQ